MGPPHNQGRAEQWSNLNKDDRESMTQAEQWSNNHDESSNQITQTITRCPTIIGPVARYVNRPVLTKHDQELTFVQIQGTDDQAEQQDADTPRMNEGYQAEQDKVELKTINREPGERAQTPNKVGPVSVQMSRDRAEQRSMPGRANSLRSNYITQLVTRCPTIPGPVARYVECPDLNNGNKNLNYAHPPGYKPIKFG